MSDLACVLQPFGLVDATPDLVRALCDRHLQRSRRPMLAVDADATGGLARALGLPAADAGFDALLREVAGAPPAAVTSAPRPPMDALAAGPDVDGAWEQVVEAAITAGLALPVRARLRAAIARIAGERDAALLAPPGRGGLVPALAATSDLVIVMLAGAPDAARVVRARDWLTRLRRDSAPNAPRRAVIVHEILGRDRFLSETALGSAPEHKWITVAHLGEPERWAAAIDALRDALRG